jgi:hypothetical protein
MGKETIDIASITNAGRIMKDAAVYVKDMDTQKIYTTHGVRVPELEGEFKSSIAGQAKIHWELLKKQGYAFLEMLSPTELEKLRKFYAVDTQKGKEILLCKLAEAVKKTGAKSDTVIAFARMVEVAEEPSNVVVKKLSSASGATVFDKKPIKVVT